jgi:hypothetical protein
MPTEKENISTQIIYKCLYINKEKMDLPATILAQDCGWKLGCSWWWKLKR